MYGGGFLAGDVAADARNGIIRFELDGVKKWILWGGIPSTEEPQDEVTMRKTNFDNFYHNQALVPQRCEKHTFSHTIIFISTNSNPLPMTPYRILSFEYFFIPFSRQSFVRNDTFACLLAH